MTNIRDNSFTQRNGFISVFRIKTNKLLRKQNWLLNIFSHILSIFHRNNMLIILLPFYIYDWCTTRMSSDTLLEMGTTTFSSVYNFSICWEKIAADVLLHTAQKSPTRLEEIEHLRCEVATNCLWILQWGAPWLWSGFRCPTSRSCSMVSRVFWKYSRPMQQNRTGLLNLLLKLSQ